MPNRARIRRAMEVVGRNTGRRGVGDDASVAADAEFGCCGSEEELFRASSVSISLVLDSLRPNARPMSGRVDEEAASEGDADEVSEDGDAAADDDMGDDGAASDAIDMALGEAAGAVAAASAAEDETEADPDADPDGADEEEEAAIAAADSSACRCCCSSNSRSASVAGSSSSYDAHSAVTQMGQNQEQTIGSRNGLHIILGKCSTNCNRPDTFDVSACGENAICAVLLKFEYSKSLQYSQ